MSFGVSTSYNPGSIASDSVTEGMSRYIAAAFSTVSPLSTGETTYARSETSSPSQPNSKPASRTARAVSLRLQKLILRPAEKSLLHSASGQVYITPSCSARTVLPSVSAYIPSGSAVIASPSSGRISTAFSGFAGFSSERRPMSDVNSSFVNSEISSPSLRGNILYSSMFSGTGALFEISARKRDIYASFLPFSSFVFLLPFISSI